MTKRPNTELRNNIVGGPSVIFCRYHEDGVTKIRNGEMYAKTILGFDCNSMYVEAMARDMPTGC